MTPGRPGVRIAGWLLASAVAAGLISGAMTLAPAAERRPTVVVLDMSREVPAAPAISVVAEAAPEVADAVPPAPEVSEPEDAVLVVPDHSPQPATTAAATLSPPQSDAPVAADLSLPAPKAEPDATPDPTFRPKAQTDRRPEPPSETKAQPKEEPDRSATEGAPAAKASAASAPSPAAKPEGGSLSPASYAKAVMKQVRSTRRATGTGKGTAVVGFTIAADGRISGLEVLHSSGNARLDEAALDHIGRSAPFPAPPQDLAGRGYSFEFVGR